MQQESRILASISHFSQTVSIITSMLKANIHINDFHTKTGNHLHFIANNFKIEVNIMET
jgi:hypothetical protein